MAAISPAQCAQPSAEQLVLREAHLRALDRELLRLRVRDERLGAPAAAEVCGADAEEV